MDDTCDLRAANGQHGRHCDGSDCPFWRVIGHVADEPGHGCAIRHFEMLGNDEMAAWLLSVKERMERLDGGC